MSFYTTSGRRVLDDKPKIVTDLLFCLTNKRAPPTVFLHRYACAQIDPVQPATPSLSIIKSFDAQEVNYKHTPCGLYCMSSLDKDFLTRSIKVSYRLIAAYKCTKHNTIVAITTIAFLYLYTAVLRLRELLK